ncbi:serine/threonine-protein kinase [Gordonia neofelifaecis]|uniref:non-specific serine/threonine protein kinase n=1 Tax=Gordonia neofelifaecis NRRL B-59395 TaxID=644548 RepID=F1YLC3_9ACTN|nr:serine/threonine-protein kinase [Gordonia neofelifaecis]EGD54583.1 serine/threonine protein kinase [Gordonia neofelifaecis NRRL B-59395]
MSLQNGTIIADRYRLVRLIATGGMGQVWEALDTRLGRRVAVKVLKAEYSNDSEFLGRFRTEAQTTARLNDPGIANVFDYGETPDRNGGDPLAYLVMELVDGEPLNSVISRMGQLSLPHTLDMLEQTGRALQAAHTAGLVHRDVKPGNILITPTGQVKITDFGIAKATDAAPVTQTGMVMGTAQYISPEQATGGEATAASDVYSLGVVGYEALTGRRPFLGDGAITVAMKHIQEPPPALPQSIPAPVRELIEITLSKDPAQRYATGGEFADAVAAVRAGNRPPVPRTALGAAGVAAAAAAAPYSSTRAMTSAQTQSQPPRTAPSTAATPVDDGGWSTTHKVLTAVAALLLLAAIALVAYWLTSSPRTPVAPTPTHTTTTTVEEPTTTYEQPTRTRETTTESPTTTTEEPTTSEETTTSIEETPSETTRPPLFPPITIPGLPGGGG